MFWELLIVHRKEVIFIKTPKSQVMLTTIKLRDDSFKISKLRLITMIGYNMKSTAS